MKIPTHFSAVVHRVAGKSGNGANTPAKIAKRKAAIKPPKPENVMRGKVAGYIKKHGEVHLNEIGNGTGKYLSDMRSELSKKKIGDNPGNHPVHQAVRELMQGRHLEHSQGSYGAGTVRLKKKRK